MQHPEQWHMDKRVPIALILTFAVSTIAQIGTGVWWASAISQRVAQIEAAQQSSSNRAERVEITVADQGQRLAVLTEAVANTNRNLERLQSEIAATNALLRDLLRRDEP
jgi:uncharacterized coiled-coil protein SlyX